MELKSKSGQEYFVAGSIVDLTTVKEKKIDWSWKPYLPVGKLVILDGDGGKGKTTLLLDIAARMSRNEPMPDGTRTGVAGAVYVTYEDGIDDTLLPRLRKAGADISKVKAIKDVSVVTDDNDIDTRPFSLAEDLPLLAHAVQQVQARLVVIDPIMSALEGNINSFKDQDVRRALSPLVTFAEEYGVTVVMVRHYTKQNTENVNHKGVGSMAFVNVSRVGLAVLDDPTEDGGMLLVHSKHNLTKEAKPLRYRVSSDNDDVARIDWQGTSDLSIRQIMSSTKPGETRQEIMNALAQTREGLTSSSIEAYMESRGTSRSTTRVTLKRMRDDKQLEQTARGKYKLLEPVA